ncbi:hypothetical protein [Halogeometricum luteum]|uniref:Uncharacterized protein n=1 Tax=Halogeometricum luteum TaxID=2950537 RepID=A0ABU2G8Q5_9EURY|nr:hypothetical protein [Halogeometricum sp. S3BR5-2]MDS0296659.1 hypothetical protein [Halogeometricum sp. S3BR5-2]
MVAESAIWIGGSSLVGATIGALASLGGTYWLHNRQQAAEEQRLRQALIAEIDSMDIAALDAFAEKLEALGSKEDRENNIQTGVREGLRQAGDEDLFEDLSEERKKKILHEGAGMLARPYVTELDELSEIDLSSNVYDSNLDKIGVLDVSDIDEVITYYNDVHKVQRTVASVTEAFESGEQKRDIAQFSGRLKRQIDGLNAQKEDVLEILRK